MGLATQVVDFPLIAEEKTENAGKCHSESVPSRMRDRLGPLGAALQNARQSSKGTACQIQR